jgi:hypothetical protein
VEDRCAITKGGGGAGDATGRGERGSGEQVLAGEVGGKRRW